MEIWFQRIGLAILFLIMELFVLNAYFLIIGITAIIIGVLSYMFDVGQDKQTILILIFIFICILNIYVLGYVIKPIFFRNKDVGDFVSKFIGEKLIVQIVDNERVVYTDGNYTLIEYEGDINPGDTVEIIEKRKQKFFVKKVF